MICGNKLLSFKPYFHKTTKVPKGLNIRNSGQEFIRSPEIKDE